MAEPTIDDSGSAMGDKNLGQPALAGALAGAAAPDGASPDAGQQGAVPEKYEDWKMPEGFALDSEIGGEFGTTAKELGLSQEQSQRLADIGAKLVQKQQADVSQQWDAARSAWRAEVQADPEIGGAKMQQNLEHAYRAIKRFGDEGLREVLDSGWGDHPALIRLMVRIGKGLGEDQSVGSRGGGAGEKSAAEVLYGGN